MTKGEQTSSMPRTTCAQFSRSLNPSRPWQRYCSNICRSRWHTDTRRRALMKQRARPRATLIGDSLAVALDEEMNRRPRPLDAADYGTT